MMPRRYTQEEFISLANRVHDNFYDYSRTIYTTFRDKVEIVCPIHGSFWTKPAIHTSGHKCPQCSILSGLLKKTYSFEKFVELANAKHNNKYSYDRLQYESLPIRKSDSVKLNITCPVHGQFNQIMHSHLKGHGCAKCGKIKNDAVIKISVNELLSRFEKVHKNYYTYDFSKFVDTRSKIDIICPKHGAFIQSVNSHLIGKGCYKCRRMFWKKENQWLDKIGLPNNSNCRQVTININDKKRIIVDGLNEETNTVYEFFGDFWHGNIKRYDKNAYNNVLKLSFGELYLITMQRVTTIREMGYNIVYIWESDFDKQNA